MRAADADILIVPGWSNSGPDHWQSRWQAKLSTARRVAQRDFEKPIRAEWEETIAREVLASARPVVIVAHSLGVIATLHAAQRVADRIAGAFLVAPPSEAAIRELPAVDSAFLPIPRARLSFPTAMVGSSDDPYADLLFARHLARDIGAEFIDAGASGHINVDSGHGPWPEGSLAFANFMGKI
ncbi:MAG: RBBP9/YdeN family alpha/beta hydrolase [Methylocystis sp.]